MTIADETLPASRVTIMTFFVVLLLFVISDVFLLRHMVRVQTPGFDFLAIWAGLRQALVNPAQLYDFAAVTGLQRSELRVTDLVRPFAYPPSALPLLVVLGMLPFRIAFVVFSVLSSGAMLATTWRLVGDRWAMVLLVIAPIVVLAGSVGQLSFLIAALVLFALSTPERPIISGVALGIAASVKPQLLVLLPVALVAARQWRTLASASVTVFAMILASIALVGAGAWIAWVEALPRFTEVTLALGLLPGMLTPTSVLMRMGVDGAPLRAAQLVFALGGIAVAWWGFRRPRPVSTRLVSLVAGSLMLAPYGMNYELAVLAPAAVAVTPGRNSPFLKLLAVLALHVLVPPPLALLMLVVAVFVADGGAARTAAHMSAPASA
ncbi:MAG: glycosyltransferase family 87 protein [Gemmatimonadota bacterium]